MSTATPFSLTDDSPRSLCTMIECSPSVWPGVRTNATPSLTRVSLSSDHQPARGHAGESVGDEPVALQRMEPLEDGELRLHRQKLGARAPLEHHAPEVLRVQVVVGHVVDGVGAQPGLGERAGHRAWRRAITRFKNDGALAARRAKNGVASLRW